ncbi:helix-turn-helix transcriptional regulator [Actinopolymorpha pittospori]
MVPTPLRGRQREISVFDDWLRERSSGRGGVAVLDGTTGIGKTRMLEEVAHRAGERGFTVALGRADRMAGTAPLAVLLDALMGTDPPLVTPGGLADLTTLVDQRLWLLDRIRSALEARSTQAPVLVAIDDLHWTDLPSLWAIGALVTQLTAERVAWLFTRQSAYPSGELAALLVKLRTVDPLEVTLGPLSAEAARAVAEDLLGAAPDERLSGLIEQAGGCPFLVSEAVRLAAESEESLPGVDSVPTRLVPSGHRRLPRLDPAAMRVLEVGATFGQRFSLRDVAMVLDEPAARLLPAMRTLLDSGLLRDDGGRLAFAHELLWQSAYDQIPPAVRGAYHREAARTLLASGAAPLEVARHVFAGAWPGDDEAADVLLSAAREAASRAPATASDLYTQVLTLLPQGSTEHTRVVVEAVPALTQAGRLDQVREVARETLAAGVDWASEADIRHKAAIAESLGGNFPAALAQARAGLERPGMPDAQAALLRGTEALELAWMMDFAPAMLSGRLAVRQGEGAGERLAVSMGLIAQAMAQRLQGQLTQTLTLIERASADLVGLDTQAARWLNPRRWQAWLLTGLDRFEEAEAALAVARHDLEAYGLGFMLNTWHGYSALLRLAEGHLDDAVAAAEAAVEISEQLRNTALWPSALAVLARVALSRGDIEAARRYVDYHPPYGGSIFDLDLDLARGMVADATGDPGAAVETMRPLWRTFPDHFGILAMEPPTAATLVRIALRAGRRDVATGTVEASTRLAELNPRVASVTGAAAHAAGLLHDDPDELVQAALHYRAGPRPLALAGACLDSAIALVAHGHQDEAVPQFEHALRVFTRADATAEAERVRVRLRALGQRRQDRAIPPRPTTGWAALSESELRVARLVAAGLTNRAAADRLSLSPHTVDSHLRHIFAKLRINTRVDLTRAVLAHEATVSGSLA